MHTDSPAADGREGLHVLTARVDGQHVAFPLAHVHEVLPAAETTRLTHAPTVVLGLLNLRGAPLPVLDLRARLGLPRSEPDPADHVLVCRVGDRTVGVWVDRAQDVTTVDPSALADLPPDAPSRHLAGVALLDDDLLLVTDVDSFLSVDEMTLLDQALAAEELADA